MIGIDLIALHMLGDYILQTDKMAQHKLNDWRWRLIHVLAYTLPFAVWYVVLGYSNPVYFVAYIFVTHFAIDSQRFAKNNPWPPMSILIDQSLHLLTLAIVGHWFIK